jgi:signal transduction histidine kinase
MEASSEPGNFSVPLESVLRTEELRRRPARPPNHQAENRALLVLTRELANSPGNVLQSLVDTALELCRGHSAGISLLEEDGPSGGVSSAGNHFRWHAVAGAWAPLGWNTTTPRHYGPCGTVLDRNATLLFSNAHRFYTQFADVHPLLVEGLLVPFHVNGQAVGTVWVVAHDETRKFDAEDQRLLESLATFAATAYHVRSSVSALAKVNEDLKAENVERRRAEDAVREADRRKTEFLALLAHELRNPLAPIRNALQLMRLTPQDTTSGPTAVDMMDRQVAHVVRLVDDLLDVSRISRGTIELRKEALDLSTVVNQAVEAARSFCKNMGHELTVMLPKEPTYLNADPTRLAQVVGNLLNNACKFTERGGHIRLTVEREGKRAVIRVLDTGIGMAPDQLPRIFEMFTQLDTSLQRSRDGLGIGLTLVKNLVELHGGTIEARSGGLGQGSEFAVSLPIDLERLPPQRSDVVIPKTTLKRRILVVDDNEDAAMSLAMLLKLSGHEVVTAHDGLRAVEEAARFHPDVVLLDIGLPKLNGYDAAARIRKQRQDDVLLVALTGWGQEEDRSRAVEAGFDVHMVKPVDLRLLSSVLSGQSA